MKRMGLFLAALALLPSPVFAGGFQVGEMSARAMGMGSAFTSVADDASAAWYNPAGTAFLDGNRLMVGGDVITTKNSFVTNASNPLNPASANAKNGTFFIPHAYLTYRGASSNVAASLGINSPFGLTTDWPTTAPFSSKNTYSRINLVMVNPNVAYRLSEHLSFAAGVDYVNMYNVDLNNTAQTLHGTGDGWGANAALLYKGDGVNFGVSYRSRVKVKVNGTATAVAGGTLALNGATASGGNTSITLPDQVNVGLAWSPNDQWTLSGDIDWVNWKTFDAIHIAYSNATYTAVLKGVQAFLGVPPTGTTTIPENWKATVAFRLGAEWKYNDHMRARFGFIYDPTPIDAVNFSPSVPGNDRQLYCIGYGYDFTPDSTLDLSYAYVHINNRNQTQSPASPALAPESVKNGLYKGSAHILAASISTKF